MASSIPSYLSLSKPSYRRTTSTPVGAMQVRSQRFRDEGKYSSGIVDANLSVLRERIEEVKIKERLERSCRCEYGWNYAPMYDNNYKPKKEVRLSAQLFDFVVLVCGTVGFTCLSGSLFLFLVSLLVHLSQ